MRRLHVVSHKAIINNGQRWVVMPPQQATFGFVRPRDENLTIGSDKVSFVEDKLHSGIQDV